MEHESFEDPATAELMNEGFVNVKVDREERPDLDAIYMDAVVALTGQGGWPMTVFLTPEGEPFFGGTYFPPEPRHGLPSFGQVLAAVSDAYRERRGDVTRQADSLVEAIRVSARAEPSHEPLTAGILGEAVHALRAQFDAEWGGFGRAPKFPPASALELLLPFEHGRFVLRGELDEETRARLFELREQRPKPLRDDKAIAAWNGMAVAALAEAGRRLERADLVAAAVEAAEFLLGPLSDEDGRLFRTHRAGRSKGTGYLEDYAHVANGLYELHVATGEARWLEESRRLALLAVDLFADEDRGGFFLSPAHGEALVARTKDLDDHPTPSGNSMLAYVVLRLARIYGDDELERRAVGVFRLVRDALGRAPTAFGHMLCALDLHFSRPREIAIVGPPESDVARAALAGFDPNAVVAFGPAGGGPPLEGKKPGDGPPAVYGRQRVRSQGPATDPGGPGPTQLPPPPPP